MSKWVSVSEWKGGRVSKLVSECVVGWVGELAGNGSFSRLLHVVEVQRTDRSYRPAHMDIHKIIMLMLCSLRLICRCDVACDNHACWLGCADCVV